MSNKFLNDHSVRTVKLIKILRITAGHFHCWCDSNVGVIRKPRSMVPEFLWDIFFGRGIKTIVKKGMTYKLKEEKIKWYKRFWCWWIKKPNNEIGCEIPEILKEEIIKQKERDFIVARNLGIPVKKKWYRKFWCWCWIKNLFKKIIKIKLWE